ncbi:MAG: hypothetical protein GY874_11175 [Desulfobacteraceae bacterium]|nr:hypothetical protein [Desulfobacteraceae bacterium]
MKTVNIHRGILYFDPDDPIYAEHFPGHAVVPGSLIIQGFITAAGDMLGDSRLKWEPVNFGFRQFACPGHYDFRIEEREPGCLECFLLRGETMIASGRLKC